MRAGDQARPGRQPTVGDGKMRRHLERETALRAAIALIALCLAGCETTIDDIRTYQPIRAGDFAGSYKTASGCAAAELLGRHPVNQVIREDQRTAILMFAVNSDYIIYEATLREISNDRFRAEIRSAKGLHGTEAPVALTAWSAIEKCAAKA